MQKLSLVLGAVVVLVLAGCGADVGQGEAETAPEDVGVATSELTNCSRTELANVTVGCSGPNYDCRFRLMINNFNCSEGVVGQASTEALSGNASTFTSVATQLFGQNLEGHNGGDVSPVSIATQWGNAFGSSHTGYCIASDGVWYGAVWNMDPWAKRAVIDPEGNSCQTFTSISEH